MSYQTRALAFAQRHQPGDPIVLYNIWDAGSALAVEQAGAQALATGSWSVAAAQGYGDGEQLPLDLLLTIVRRISESCELPLSVDFEGAYAVEPEQVTQNVQRLVEAGAIGLNFEDQIVGGEGLYDVATQGKRVAAVRAANEDFFINARTDLFLKEKDRSKHEALLPEALERAATYGEAGASGFFVPGLTDTELLARFCGACPLPVNAMMRGLSISDAAMAGVARCSYGPMPYAKAMKQVAEAFSALS
ncbi:hypothetical protein RSK20926_07402 [Roseobacter sp. SK209-2-6]|uniref:isocitrate lyase/PEP mutase family protein n=1 Tax=Roseobacter sp. SK209-2-6 TaxID=388739 RepID=UPI0000F3D6DA|nr:isocitrate lyase/phosphoenolpyruvate mutase family protein [Roseobacter sp. SK209-2-6]EBA17545.1 hypothetical protein RSK20926_07402 [Roseobacter sp. SK209-2-6]